MLTAMDHVNIRTANLGDMVRWYKDVLGMPTGQPFLYADHLNSALTNMVRVPRVCPYTSGFRTIRTLCPIFPCSQTSMQMFDQLTFYVEACESGSIFKKLLPNDTSIYATTAANPQGPLRSEACHNTHDTHHSPY